MTARSHPSVMLAESQDPFSIHVRESCGLEHESQIIRVRAPEGKEPLLVLRKSTSDQPVYMQRSQCDPLYGFLRLAIAPFEEIHLSLNASDISLEAVEDPVQIQEEKLCWILENSRLRLRVPRGSGTGMPPGPVAGCSLSTGPWRGGTFLDIRQEHGDWTTVISERGPLRVKFVYRFETVDEHFYECEIILDAGMDFVRIKETSHMDVGDQIVWRFTDADLPHSLWLLDSSASHNSKPLRYELDACHARLWCWTQYSQLQDLSDGFALEFVDADDMVGWVTLEGGAWQGNSLNHLEAWCRRWDPEDPQTRRLLPWQAKADSLPGHDRIPARGESQYQPVFSAEGWIGRVERSFALVVSTGDQLSPSSSASASSDLGPFETSLDRARYASQQGRLRKIHTQFGLMPLQRMIDMTFEWPMERPADPDPDEEQKVIAHLTRNSQSTPDAPVPDLIAIMEDYLAARVYGFWEGSGSAYTNCVVGRRIAHEVLHWKKLNRIGLGDAAWNTRMRAWLAFLIQLFESENYYPGDSTMQPLGDKNTVEPTLAGMANQNFYTDIINLLGVSSAVFHQHPQAPSWRRKFLDHWHWQLECHMYPASGVWEESHTYFQHVLKTLLPTLRRLRLDGHADEFANPKFHKLLSSVLLQVTPRDAAFAGVRHLVPFGDHAVDVETYRDIYLEYAEQIVAHNQALAAQLLWLYQEMGGQTASDIAPKVPDFETGQVEGLGYFFRTLDAQRQEAVLAVRSGGAWGHHHNDDGSVQLVGAGRSLIVDSGFGSGKNKHAARGHSRSIPEGVDPMNYMWRFNRGRVLEAMDEGPHPFVRLWLPTTMSLPGRPLDRVVEMFRTCVQLDARSFLFLDWMDESRSGKVLFHVASEQSDWDGVRFKARWDDDVQLWLHPFGNDSAVMELDSSGEAPTTRVELAGLPGTLVGTLVSFQPNRGQDPDFVVSETEVRWSTGDTSVLIGLLNNGLSFLTAALNEPMTFSKPRTPKFQ